MPVSPEFERGVRFVMERTQTFTKGEGAQVTQFGDYQFSLQPNSYTGGSTKHIERLIQAFLAVAAKEAN